MAVEKDIALNVLGRIDEFRTELAKMPGITEKAAGKAALKMQSKFATAATKQAQQQKKAATQATAIWAEAGKIIAAKLTLDLVKGMGKALLGMRQELADTVNEMGDLSGQTGVSVQTLNAFRFAVESSGGELGELQASLRGFPKRLDDFRRGTGEAKVAMEQLGFSSEDGAAMLGDVDGTIIEVIKRLKGVEDPGKQAALATQLFGESGVRLNQVLGDRSIEDWVKTAELGIDVSDQNVVAAQRWEQQVTLLGATWDKSKQTMVEALDIDDMVRQASGLIVGFAHVVGTMLTEGIENAAWAFTALRQVAGGDLQGAFTALKKIAPIQDMKDLKQSTFEAVEAFRAEQKALGALTQQAPPFIQTLHQTSEEQKKVAASTKAAESALQAQHTAMLSLRGIVATLTEDTLTDAQKVERAFQDQVVAIIDAGAQMANTAETAELVEAALHEARLRRNRELQTIEMEANTERINQLHEWSKADAELQLEASERAQQRFDTQSEQELQLVSIMGGAAGSLSSILESAADATSKRNKKQAMQLAKGARAIGLFEVGVNTSSAVMQAFAMFGPPPSPVGIAAGLAAGVAGAAQVAAIRAQAMPSFFGGGIVPGGQAGEQMVRAHGGEAMLNTAGRRALGDDIIGALNAGLQPLQNMGSQSAPVILDGMQVGMVMADQGRRQGPLRQSIVGDQPVGFVSPYGRN